MTERTIASLCQRSHEMSRSKGWYNGEEKDPRPISLITLLMQSELIEALEEWRSNRAMGEIYFSGPAGQTVPGPTRGVLPESEWKPEGILVELADFVIRVCQRAGSDGVDLERMMNEATDRLQGLFSADFETMLATEMANVSMAYIVTASGGDRMTRAIQMQARDVSEWLAFAAAGVFAFCKQNKLDLWSAIELKEKYNGTRPHRHGGKKA